MMLMYSEINLSYCCIIMQCTKLGSSECLIFQVEIGRIFVATQPKTEMKVLNTTLGAISYN